MARDPPANVMQVLVRFLAWQTHGSVMHSTKAGHMSPLGHGGLAKQAGESQDLASHCMKPTRSFRA